MARMGLPRTIAVVVLFVAMAAHAAGETWDPATTAETRAPSAAPGSDALQTVQAFLTALGDEESVQEGIRCGGDDFVSKPVKPGDLRVRIRSLLQIGGDEDELVRALNYIRILGEESEKKSG